MNRKRCPNCGRIHLANEAVRKDKRTGELQYTSAHKHRPMDRYLCRCRHCQGYYGVRGLSLGEYLLLGGLIALSVWLGKGAALILIPILVVVLISQLCFPQEVPKREDGQETIDLKRSTYEAKILEGKVPPKGAILLWSRNYDQTELYSTPAPIRVVRTSSIHRKMCFEFVYDHEENDAMLSGEVQNVYCENRQIKFSALSKE